MSKIETSLAMFEPTARCRGFRGTRLNSISSLRKPRRRASLLVLEKGIGFILIALTGVVLPSTLGGVRVIRTWTTRARIAGITIAGSLIHPAEKAGITTVTNAVVAGRRLAGWPRLIRITLVVSLILKIPNQTPRGLVEGSGDQGWVNREGREIEAAHSEGVRHAATAATTVILTRYAERLEIRHIEITPVSRIVPAVRTHVVTRMTHVPVALVVSLHVILDRSWRAPASHVRVHLVIEILIVSLGLWRSVRDVHGNSLYNVIFSAERLGYLGI